MEKIGSRESKEQLEKRVLDELDKLLAEICEKGADMDLMRQKVIRQKIQDCLLFLGIKNLEDIEGLMKIYERLHEVFFKNPKP